MQRTWLASFILFSLILSTCALYYPDLTHEDFDSVIDGSKPALIELYAPWCGHCQALAPEIERLGESVKNNMQIIVAQIDADKDKVLSERFQLQGYPTIKLLSSRNTTSDWIEYTGERTATGLVAFIQNHTQQSIKLIPVETFVVELTDDNFDKVVMDPYSHVLVEFYAPWCGHCKTLKPQLEKVAKTYHQVKGVVIAAIDADKYGKLAEKYRVTGFPTLKYFPAGKDKKPMEYDSSRMAIAIVEFMNRQVGLDLDVGGELLQDAGRVEVMDNYARDFITSNISKHESIRQAAEEEINNQNLRGQLLQNARFYLTVMERYSKNGGDAYLNKELSKIEKELKRKDLSPHKRNNLIRKQNIIKFFATIKDSEYLKAQAVGDALDDDDAN
ncbi:protein disulfide-isomerase A4 [Galdieria sulphuraria]|uniref:protein disulfide-isomerase n=1 Tax=Galdieria sulphuraria TaxID=130081 RepID=M2XZR8_GALSU|nr:protein disulfide-isomerase A4 [Galdieria sulphuraria]EME29074.1 protein disulfide-isomerase A4 [Galdieria sulphuraria]|eukprot:XP_005705594.1 protein disulfide-isomerase A4 [Galdieria sulphuraria]